MEFSRQEYWSRLPFPAPGDLPNPGIEPRSIALQADSLLTEPLGKVILNFKLAHLLSAINTAKMPTGKTQGVQNHEAFSSIMYCITFSFLLKLLSFIECKDNFKHSLY